ncbi:DUF305 domain-containing protein [Pseudolysinimonas yzui]|uniref:DUF305 domain-containing protein n=1 Tax=Pseudolysinimonas yzui TaxID=2708254 RepID=A0A8J3GQ00_9MICO|nr:DUF305 domain-containing protein [Pseudolysinimonas yzui]GHF14159.1 DUF305 domain-containing protein [Pseudolysinimonas yzui]
MTRGRVVAVILAAVLLIAGAFALGRVAAGTAPTPTTDSAAAGFLRDMQVHHAQAVEMALLVRDRTDDETVRTIAYDMAVTQAGQSGAMYGLLDAWDLPQRSAQRAMAWTELPALDGSDSGHQMDPDAPGGMPGLATDAEVAELEAATGDAAVRLFLKLMIAHHEGGVEMADAVLARTDVPQVVTLAEGIRRAQQAEIDAMTQLLAALPPE